MASPTVKFPALTLKLVSQMAKRMGMDRDAMFDILVNKGIDAVTGELATPGERSLTQASLPAPEPKPDPNVVEVEARESTSADAEELEAAFGYRPPGPDKFSRVWRYPEQCPGDWPLTEGEWAYTIKDGRSHTVVVMDEDNYPIHSEKLTQEDINKHDLKAFSVRVKDLPRGETFAATEFRSHPIIDVKDVNPWEPYRDPDMQEAQQEVNDALRALVDYPEIMTNMMIHNGKATGVDGVIEFKVEPFRYSVRGSVVYRIGNQAGAATHNPGDAVHPADAAADLRAYETDAKRWEAWGSKAPRMLRNHQGENLHNRNPFWFWIEPCLEHWQDELELDLDMWKRIKRKLCAGKDAQYRVTETKEFLGNHLTEDTSVQVVHSMEFIREALHLHNESIESREYRLSSKMVNHLRHLIMLYR